MKKMFVVVLFIPFLITGCEVNRKLADSSTTPTTSEAFYAMLDDYIDNVDDSTACENLDKIALLKATAKEKGYEKLLSHVNIAGMFLTSYMTNVDALDVQKRLDSIKKQKFTKVSAKSAKVSAERKATSTATISDYFVALFGDCVDDDQAKWETMVGVVEDIYTNHASLILAVSNNESIAKAIDGDGYLKAANCAIESDEYIKNSLLPYIKSVSLSSKIEDEKTFAQKVIDKAPDCFKAIFDSDDEKDAEPADSK